jgi:LCP family protein required for cell wall assembly
LGKVDLASTNQQAIEAGFSAIDESLGDVLGINISYHVLVNFQAFRQAIDSVDGVTVDVTSQLYDPTMAWENGNNPVLAAAGSQTMHGKQALNFARSRETSSDFARSERQRQLLVALKEKVLTLGTLSSPSKITSLMNTFGSNVHTDLSTQAASRLLSIMKGIDDSDIASLSLTTPTSLVTTDRVGNISVVRPKAGFNTYSEIQTYVRSQLKDGYLVQEQASVQVVASTETLAAQTADTLKSYGYSIAGSSVTSGLQAGVTVVDKSAGKAPYTLHYLQDRYGLAAVTELPKGVVVPNSTQFVIIVGT